MAKKRKSRKTPSSDDDSGSEGGSRKEIKRAKRAIKILWGKAIPKAYQDKSYSEYKEDDWDKMNEQVTNLIKGKEHPRVFTELEELQSNKDGGQEWKETARWIKFEENVETGANRWSKPHVGTLSVHAYFQLEKHLKSDGVFLDCEAQDIAEVNKVILDYLKDVTKLNEDGLEEVGIQLKAKNNHASTRRSRAHIGHKLSEGAEGCLIHVGVTKHLTQRIACFIRLKDPLQPSDLLEIHIPVRFVFHMMGPEKSKNHFHEMGRCFATLMSDEVWHEVAYSANTSDDLILGMREFMDKAWILPPDEWDPSIRIEPPNVRNQNRRAEICNRRIGQSQGVDFGDGGAKADDHAIGNELSRTGRCCGGLLDDIKRKKPFYVSDFTDPLKPRALAQCIATFIFLYFAIITPIVTFGGLLGDATDNNMAAMESIFGGAIAGSLYHLFAGQPLTIIGSTGPILVFETIMYNMCKDLSESSNLSTPLNYLELRWWVGMFTGLFCIIIVITDGSVCVKYITRYTEESFATLISLIFIVDGLKKLMSIKTHSPVNYDWSKENILSYSCRCEQPSYSKSSWYNSSLHTTDWWNTNASSVVMIENKAYTPERTWANESTYWCLYKDTVKSFSSQNGQYFNLSQNVLSECFDVCGQLTGSACAANVYVPDVYYFSCFLGIMTLVMSLGLKQMPSSRFGSRWFKMLIADFAVIIAIALAITLDIYVGLDTPKLSVPTEFRPTRPDRGWLIPPIKYNPPWAIALAIPFAILATILIFMDQQITAVIVNRRENKLQKGCGYHLDLLMVAIALMICSCMGLPWFVAATVLSITHVNSLKRFDGATAPGEAPEFSGVYEQRLTGVLIFLLIGSSVLFTGLLNTVPLPVLYGVFIYMGISSLKGNQLFDRLLLLLMPAKYQPDYVYLRHVELHKVHLFTVIQLIGFIILWTVKSIKSASIAFPIMVVGTVGIRKLFDYFPNVFSQRELSWLDDELPHDERKTEDDLKGKSEPTSCTPGTSSAKHTALTGRQASY